MWWTANEYFPQPSFDFGGSSTPQTQTTKTELPEEAQELFSLAMPGFREFAANPPQRFQGQRTAGFTPAQEQGQQLALDAASPQQDIAQGAAGANQFLFGDALFPETNPALQQTIDAAVRPITEQLTESTLPAIRSEATQTGNFGSSRQGIAEGIASREASRAAGDTAANVATEGYLAGLEGLQRGLALTPQTQVAQTVPATTTSAVGDVRQALDQALINEEIANFDFDQLAPFLTSKELASIATGIPGGATTTTASTPQQNPITTGLGGALTGAQIGSMVPGIGTGLGAGAGALLSLLV